MKRCYYCGREGLHRFERDFYDEVWVCSAWRACTKRGESYLTVYYQTVKSSS